MMNFTGWVNRQDVEGRNVFQGGFLGLDNIGVFDRSQKLPVAGRIDQSDGTSWMAMYALNMMRISLELATRNHVYESTATKFFEHFLAIAEAMTRQNGRRGLWDEVDQFYHNVLQRPDGSAIPLRLFSLVGLFPLFAVEVLEPETLARCPEFAERLQWVLDHRPDLAALVSHWDVEGQGSRRLLSLLRGSRMKALLRRMLDETAFLSPYGVRSVSRAHLEHPFELDLDGQHFSVGYVPGDSNSRAFGGNSNWRGTGVDAGEFHAGRGAVWIPPLLRRRFPGGISDRLRRYAQPAGDRRRTVAAPDAAVPARAGRPAPGFRRPARCSRTIRISATTSCSTSSSTATPARGSALRTRPAGPGWSPCCCTGGWPTTPPRWTCPRAQMRYDPAPLELYSAFASCCSTSVAHHEAPTGRISSLKS